MDDLGMAHEIVVNLEEEVEDLNADLLTTDRESDSPQPMSSREEAAMDIFEPDSVLSEDTDADILRVVPSTQPVSPRTPPQRVTRRYSEHRVARSRLPPPPPASASTPDFPATGMSGGRGILCLHAPPKSARTPALRRRPPPCSALPLPQWTFTVRDTPIVEFRAETPTVLDPTSEPGNRLPLTDVFQDTDEDLRPLTGFWAEIIEREEREAAA